MDNFGRPGKPARLHLRPGGLKVWQAYACSFAVTTATLGVRLAFDGVLGGPTLVMFTLPIMASAYLGGLGAGLFATALSALFACYYLLPPFHSFHVASAADGWQLFVVVLAGVFISVLNEALHRAQSHADIATRERHHAEDERQRFFARWPDVLCVLGFDGYFRDLNPTWETTLGYARAEMLGTPFIEFVHPDDQAATLAEAKKVSAGKALVAFENRYRCKDGSYRWFQWSVTPVVADGVMYGVARDVTECKAAERRLGMRHAVSRVLADAASLAEAAPGIIRAIGEAELWDFGSVWEVDPAVGMLCCVDIWHHPDFPGETMGAETRGLTLPIGQGLPGRVWAAAKMQFVPDVTLDEGYLCEGNTIAPGLHSALAFPILVDNQVAGVIDFAARDIPQPDERMMEMYAAVGRQIGQFIERKREAEALRKSEAEFRTLSEAMPQIVWMTRPDGWNIYFNQQWMDYTGLSLEESLGHGWDTPFHPADKQRARDAWQMATETLGPYTLECRLRRADGAYRWWLVRGVPLRDASGSVVKWLGTCTDVEALKQAEAALRESEQHFRFLHDLVEATRPLADAGQIMAVMSRMLGEYLRVSRCTYADVEADGEQFTIQDDYTDGCETSAGRYALSLFGARAVETLRAGQILIIRDVEAELSPVDGADMFHALGVNATITCPLVKDGRLRAMMAVHQTTPRDWKAREIAIVQDVVERCWAIIERRSAEESLFKAGDLQRAIFNSADFSCIATDANGVIQIFNVGAERMLGYTAAEVVNRITPAELHDAQEVIARAAALNLEFSVPIAPGFEALAFKASRGIEDIYELTKVRKDGTTFPAVVSVTALRDPHDAVIGYLFIGTDNTVRKQVEQERRSAEQERQRSEARYRTLFERAPDGILIANPEGYYLDANSTMCEMLGYARSEVVGRHASDIVVEADIPRVGPGLGEIDAASLQARELRFHRKDDSVFDAEVIATTMPDGNLLAVVRDITERKNVQRELQEKNVELEEASRTKSEFLANVSHELRTPLNAIIGFSEVLKDGLLGELGGRQQKFIADIFSSGRHLLSLINDILDLSKVEAGKMVLDLESAQISSLFANSLSIIREEAAARRVGIEMDVPDDVGAIYVDARKVKQIVYNLLANAVKFSHEGGQVTLRAVCVARADVGRPSVAWSGRSLGLADNEFLAFLEIRVTDNGIGIAPVGLAQLFKPFSQIDSGLARKFEGTGLGLAMVKLLAELHGGAVAVESAVGHGSCFTVWLPLRTAAVDTPALLKSTAIARATTPVGGRTALVVDDDFNAAELIRVQLEAEGFTVLHAASGEAALVLAVQQPLSLITLDMMLPKMDGWEFLGRLKQVPELRRVPVVIISIEADSEKGFALGAAAVMQKPIARLDFYDSLTGLGLLPVAQGRALKVLIVDDDPKAVELCALSILGLAGHVIRAYGGLEAIEAARQELPDVIVLDLMMPGVNGFDVVEALRLRPETTRIPVLIVTAKSITAGDRARLHGYMTTIMNKAEFMAEGFTAEIRRAMSGRVVIADMDAGLAAPDAA